MRRTILVVAGLTAALALAGTGSALAADAPAKQPFADQLAAKLGLTPDQFRAAIRGVLLDRIDAALAAGKLTPERAAELRQRVASGTLPRLGTVGKAKGLKKVARVKGLKEAAELLGLSHGQLKQQLRSGTSLAQLAQAKGISSDALVTAMLKPLEERLAKAVAAGRLTEAQKAERLAHARTRLTERITRVPTTTPSA